ncbi:MAG: glycosyltransferase [Bacteroidetes bacterium]|nr:glycosyltransferase [Bacteroidota bacterium]
MPTEKKSICFIVSSALTARVFLRNHINNLSSTYSVHLVGNFSESDKTELDKLLLEDYKCIAIVRQISLWHDIRSVVELYRYFRKHKFDIVHSVTPKAGLITALAAKLASIRYRIHIFTGQVWLTRNGIMRSILRGCDKLINCLSTHLLVDSVGQLNFLITEKIISPSKSSVLGNGSINGVDINRFLPDSLSRSNVRKELKIDEKRLVFLFLGRLNRDKGIMDLVKAFKCVQNDYPYIFLLIVGIDEEDLRGEIIQQLPQHTYAFIAETTQPQLYYQAADIFCLPSYREGFGTSVIEASACGLPVICSNIYGLESTIIENETGLKHTAGDVIALQDCMIKMITDPQFRIGAGENGRKYTAHFFQDRIVMDAWKKFYDQLVV